MDLGSALMRLVIAPSVSHPIRQVTASYQSYACLSRIVLAPVLITLDTLHLSFSFPPYRGAQTLLPCVDQAHIIRVLRIALQNGFLRVEYGEKTE